MPSDRERMNTLLDDLPEDEKEELLSDPEVHSLILLAMFADGHGGARSKGATEPAQPGRSRAESEQKDGELDLSRKFHLGLAKRFRRLAEDPKHPRYAHLLLKDAQRRETLARPDAEAKEAAGLEEPSASAVAEGASRVAVFQATVTNKRIPMALRTAVLLEMYALSWPPESSEHQKCLQRADEYRQLTKEVAQQQSL